MLKNYSRLVLMTIDAGVYLTVMGHAVNHLGRSSVAAPFQHGGLIILLLVSLLGTRVACRHLGTANQVLELNEKRRRGVRPITLYIPLQPITTCIKLELGPARGGMLGFTWDLEGSLFIWLTGDSFGDSEKLANHVNRLEILLKRFEPDRRKLDKQWHRCIAALWQRFFKNVTNPSFHSPNLMTPASISRSRDC